MHRRFAAAAHAAAPALLAAGIATSAVGIVANGDGDLTRAGIVATIAGGTSVIATQVRHTHRATAQQLADEHRAGYLLALDHVARGLLDQPTHDTPPHGRRYDLGQLATSNVVHLRARTAPPDRQAQ